MTICCRCERREGKHPHYSRNRCHCDAAFRVYGPLYFTAEPADPFEVLAFDTVDALGDGRFLELSAHASMQFYDGAEMETFDGYATDPDATYEPALRGVVARGGLSAEMLAELRARGIETENTGSQEYREARGWCACLECIRDDDIPF